MVNYRQERTVNRMQKKLKWILIPAGILVFLFLFAFTYCAIATWGDEVQIIHVSGHQDETVEIKNPLNKYLVMACVAEIETCPVEIVERNLFEGGIIGGEIYTYLRVKPAGKDSFRSYRNRYHGMVESNLTSTIKIPEPPFVQWVRIYHQVPEVTMNLLQYCLEL